MAEDAHDHADAHDNHDHGNVTYAGSEVEDATLEALRATHPALAETLEMGRKYADLDEAGREKLAEVQARVEDEGDWRIGYHAEGDACGGCGQPVEPLFEDLFQDGSASLAYSAMVHDLPVHADAACIEKLKARVPRPAPQLLDRVRRETMQVGGRPSARMAQFFRHDVFAHAPFGLEDWANSVADANPKMDRAARKDMERLLVWVHERLFHARGHVHTR